MPTTERTYTVKVSTPPFRVTCLTGECPTVVLGIKSFFLYCSLSGSGGFMSESPVSLPCWKKDCVVSQRTSSVALCAAVSPFTSTDLKIMDPKVRPFLSNLKLYLPW